MTATIDDPWLTVDEIAALRRVSRMTIYRAANGDFLRADRVGRLIRIRASWVDEWVADGGRTFGDHE